MLALLSVRISKLTYAVVLFMKCTSANVIPELLNGMSSMAKAERGLTQDVALLVGAVEVEVMITEELATTEEVARIEEVT